MAGATGNALEWALRCCAPGKRHALRHKPLPAGMERLLGIAAGGGPRRSGRSCARVRRVASPRAREAAAQFYAREVLFFPQADAYRVLG